MTLHTTLIRSSIAALLVVAVAACGSSPDKISSPTAAPPATEVVDTQPIVSTTGEPEIIDSVTADTVTIPVDDSVAEPAAEELRDGVPTEAGTTYAIINPSTGGGFSFVSSVDGAFPFLAINVAALSLDEAGSQGLFSVSALDNLRTFLDPSVDFMSIPVDGFEAVTEPVASDYLAWVAALPGATVGPIEETTVDGWPARSMTYEFGPSPNGLACDDTSLAGCIFTLSNPAGGSASYYLPNDTGTLYEVVVDGSRVLIELSIRPGVQEMFETVHFLLPDKG